MSQPDQTAPADPLRAPHQPISGYYQTEDERAGFLREIFDSTATDYDKVERMLALGTGPWYRRQALKRAGLAPGMQVVASGVHVLTPGQKVTVYKPKFDQTPADKAPAAINNDKAAAPAAVR